MYIQVYVYIYTHIHIYIQYIYTYIYVDYMLVITNSPRQNNGGIFHPKNTGKHHGHICDFESLTSLLAISLRTCYPSLAVL